jgi:putative Holliday junction resolvase
VRIIAFDAGTKRVGVAVGDDSLSIASPVGYLENNPRLVSGIQKLFDEYSPGMVVIGNPLNMDGSKNPNTKFADDLADIVRAMAPDKEIIMWDERLTSADATELLIKHDVSRKRRRGIIDKVAASLILQGYLDHLKKKRKQ